MKYITDQMAVILDAAHASSVLARRAEDLVSDLTAIFKDLEDAYEALCDASDAMSPEGAGTGIDNLPDDARKHMKNAVRKLVRARTDLFGG